MTPESIEKEERLHTEHKQNPEPHVLYAIQPGSMLQ